MRIYACDKDALCIFSGLMTTLHGSTLEAKNPFAQFDLHVKKVCIASQDQAPLTQICSPAYYRNI